MQNNPEKSVIEIFYSEFVKYYNSVYYTASFKLFVCVKILIKENPLFKFFLS